MDNTTGGQSPAAPFTVHILGDDPVVGYAAEELYRYLEKMTSNSPMHVEQRAYQENLGGIWLGLACDLPFLSFPTLASEFDDAIQVQVHRGQGVIAGINGRSVLLAVYRFLFEAGCRWLRPGLDGEIIPYRSLDDLTVRLVEQPSYRHRAVCIEGAVSLENVLEMVDWAPKVGLSGYFMQFREGHTFFDRWYAHTNNPFKTSRKISVEDAQAFTRQIETELEKRGMLYHAVGHGWTCEAFGISGLGWDPLIQDWPEEVTSSLALVNGRRAMWYDIPLITSLCFSNPQVRQRIVECVLEYVKTHHKIQALHFWLDDGFNNKCECDECQKMRPSDYYVMLLNELDKALTAADYPEKIVFLAYADLLWPPETWRIQNPDRYIMMFAPITRSYKRPFFPQNPDYTLPPYKRNQLVFSNNNDEQIAFLRAWQGQFPGDSFIFDYHLWRPGSYTCDPDAIFLARLLSTDIKNLKRLGLNGMVSCQLQRVFFPTGLAMYVMGRTLWNDTLSFDELLDEYFSAAFGADWQLCKEYLLSLSALQDVVPVTEKELPVAPDAQAKLAQGMKIIQQFIPIIERNLVLPDLCQSRSWFFLKFHAELLLRFLPILSSLAQTKQSRVAKTWSRIKVYIAERLKRFLPLHASPARGRKDKAAQLWDGVKIFVQENEDKIQPVFDVYAFLETFKVFFS